MAKRDLCSTVEELAKQLNDFEPDYEYSRWPAESLAEYLNDAVAVIALQRPDLFTAPKEHTLSPGCAMQQLPEGCQLLNGEVYNSGDCGNEPAKAQSVDEDNEDLLRHFTTRRCRTAAQSLAAAEEYKVNSFRIDPQNPKYFWVYPTPPAGADYKIIVSCAEDPPCLSWPEDKETDWGLPARFHPALIEYALYRAYIVDTESVTSQGRAQIHYANFRQMMQDSKLADYAYHRPDWYLVGPIEGTGPS